MNLKLNCRPTVIKLCGIGIGQTYRSLEQKLESRYKPIYLESIEWQGCQNNQWVENSLFKNIWLPTLKGINLDSYLIPHIKINSNQIKDLNVGAETVKLLGENKSL